MTKTMNTQKAIEAMVSRNYVRQDKWPQVDAKYADIVTIWTELGNWSMPYDAFTALFGICIAANTQRVTVNLLCVSE